MIERKKLKLDQIAWVVLDEADEMLSMGFKDNLDFILEKTPEDKQTLLFSATMPKSIERIALQYMQKPTTISVIDEKEGASRRISHAYYMVHEKIVMKLCAELWIFIPIFMELFFAELKLKLKKLRIV